MDEIELVVKIPKEMVQELKDGCFGLKHTLYDLAGVICNGIVLPKGHGRLIDADEFKNYCQTGLENVKPLFKTEKYCKLAIDITQGIIADVGEMKTIIEADKAESEGQDAISN